MTIESFTGIINTNGEFQEVETLTGVSFTIGNSYTMMIQNLAYIKVANAIFPITNEKFQYKAGEEDLYIRTDENNCVLTILENEG